MTAAVWTNQAAKKIMNHITEGKLYTQANAKTGQCKSKPKCDTIRTK